MNEHETDELIALSDDEQGRLVGGDCGGGNTSHCAGQKVGAFLAGAIDFAEGNYGRGAAVWGFLFG
ncbi:MAG: hypothetical protein M3081_03710 [Gemmatimonadota bacterium]|nr:hypothetical protein [Gemmatimonadota bacterium]